MAIYLGSTGYVELKRDGNIEGYTVELDPADVIITKRRFSVDDAEASLITGDEIEISTVDGSNLELITGWNYPDCLKYAYVDDAGGIRLYDEFSDALAGDLDRALVLTAPSVKRQITIKVRNTRFRPVGKIKTFDMTTSRETIDVTSLGTEFKNQYDQGLISGQGTLECNWQHIITQEEKFADSQPEFPDYLSHLLIRAKQGADFDGRFFIYHDPAVSKNSVWYEARCIVTNVVISVPAASIVESKIDFVTTGPIGHRQGIPPGYLLQEGGDLILKEDGYGILLEDD